jgi:multiple sugar transport system permease protein
MFSTALKPKADITDIPPTYLPEHWIWSNFINVFKEIEFGTYMKNTIIIALATMVIGLIASIPAGYYVARHNFRGRTLFLLVVLITQMFSLRPLCLSVFTARCRS